MTLSCLLVALLLFYFLALFDRATDDEDDYDKHNTGGDSKSYILLLGIFYVVVSVFYLAMSGELFHFVVTEDDAPEWTAESADSNVSDVCARRGTLLLSYLLIIYFELKLLKVDILFCLLFVCYMHVGYQAVAMWFISHRKHFMGIFPESIIDKPYKCCNRKVRPFRLIGKTVCPPTILSYKVVVFAVLAVTLFDSFLSSFISL